MNPRLEDRLAQAAIRGSSLRGVSRALGMSGLSVLALAAAQTHPRTGEAKRKNQKKRKRSVDRRCERQVGACEAFIASKCTVDPQDSACQEPTACCALLKQCRMADFVACLANTGHGALGAA